MNTFQQSLIGKLNENPEDRYAKLGLKFNPFPAAAIAQFTHLDPVDSDIFEKIGYFITNTYKKNVNDGNIGDYAGLTIVGSYGSGKTHLMKYIERQINDISINKSVDFSSLTAFIDRPEEKPLNIITKIIEDLQPDNLRRMIWYCIYPYLISNKDSFFETYFKTSLFTDTDKEELFRPEILGNPLVFYEKVKRLRGNINKLFEDCQNILTHSNHDFQITNDISIAQRYLGLIFPEKAPNHNWEVLTGYVTTKDVQNKEFLFLKSLVKILQKNGYGMLYVFIDEFENFATLKGAKLTNYINTLSTMINKERNWAVITSITQDALQAIKPESPQLFDRLVSVEIKLNSLNMETGKRMIDNYLNFAKKSSEVETPNVFSELLLTEMIRKTEGNARGLIKLCNKVIEKAADSKNFQIPIQSEILADINF
ncbi:hypothetical protein [Emticicia sp. SJ17W-69]|uniref:hypothetical protein n=1 Tax=Emticicia sp. SJ17W-69 TaxID=3421657 RepID=UPI003EC07C27